MPIPPAPMTYQCSACNWKRTVVPRSDCLTFGKDIFVECPRCQKPLTARPATTLEATLAKLMPRFR
ncbi:hypothetical protein C2846_18130 [Pseudomonas jilinensis]|uniref:Uncharacterized protein n=1 Tax=Pseudomonas jilinensis TaxID=2078689 RepID=A0A396RTV8_9PSED|nr:hypothetical protein C2846_18130 [Pseudomonas jilinensis]